METQASWHMGRSSLAVIAVLLGTVLAQAGPLHEAAGYGDVDTVRRLLAEGEDIRETGPLGTPLHVAALKGRLEVAQLLVAEGGEVGTPSGTLEFTPLHMAAHGGDSDVAALLVASGAAIDARNASGNMPLHMAASGGHIAVAETLIASGADLNARNDVDDAPIHFAGESGHFDTVDLLIAHGAKPAPVHPATDLLADADPASGRELFLECAGCHTIARNAPPGIGPNLWGLLEREKASQGGYDYSRALSRLGGGWSYAELNAFLADPKGFAPGTRMKGVQGVADASDRASLIVYLRANGDSPPPLPE